MIKRSPTREPESNRQQNSITLSQSLYPNLLDRNHSVPIELLIGISKFPTRRILKFGLSESSEIEFILVVPDYPNFLLAELLIKGIIKYNGRNLSVLFRQLARKNEFGGIYGKIQGIIVNWVYLKNNCSLLRRWSPLFTE